MRAVRIAKGGYAVSSAGFCIAGVLLLLHPEDSSAQICNGMGVLLMILKLQTALDARRFGLERWWLIGGAAVLASILGVLIILDPFGGSGVAGAVMLLGITLLTEGLLNLYVAVYTVKTEKQRGRINRI